MSPVHTDEMQGSVFGVATQQQAGLQQECGKFRRCHLTARHHKVVVSHTAQPTGMPLDGDVIRGIGKHHGRSVCSHERRIRRLLEGTAAIHTMRTEQPPIAGLADGRP